MASGDGASFQIDIGTSADGVESAAVALERLTAQLTSAGAASTAAAAAVSAGEASYRQAEVSADRAAKALERIGLQADAQKGKLQAAVDAGDTSGIEKAEAKLQALAERQSEASAKAADAKSALDAEAEALDRLKSAASDAVANEERLKDAQEEVTDAAKEMAGAQEEAGEASGFSAETAARGFGKLGGPLGNLGKQVFGVVGGVGKLTKSLGDAGPYAIAAVAAVALAAAFAAVAVAVVVGLAKITAWAVGLADVGRSNRLLADGIAQSVSGGALLNKKIDDLTNKVPQTREEISAMAADLAKSGLRGQALTDALEQSAIAAAKLKFGPEWEKEMNSLPQLQKRLQSGFSSLFSGLKIDKLLESLSSLVGLFSESESSGRAIKSVFESLFQPLVDGATDMVPKIRAAFLQFEILVLKALIAIKPWGEKIKLAAEIVGVLAIAIGVGLAAVIGVIVVAFAMAAVTIGLAVAIIAALVAGIVWLAVKMGDLGASVEKWIIGKFNDVKAFFAGFSLSQMGADLIQGLVDGITGAGGKVLDAVKGAVGGAVDGAKKLLGIASPSKVFAEIGMQTGAGMAKGVDASTGDVQGSLESMVAPPATPALEALSGAKAAPAKGENSSGGSNFAGATFIFNGVEGAQDAEARFSELLTKVVEGDTTQLGAARAT